MTRGSRKGKRVSGKGGAGKRPAHTPRRPARVRSFGKRGKRADRSSPPALNRKKILDKIVKAHVKADIPVGINLEEERIINRRRRDKDDIPYGDGVPSEVWHYYTIYYQAHFDLDSANDIAAEYWKPHLKNHYFGKTSIRCLVAIKRKNGVAPGQWKSASSTQRFVNAFTSLAHNIETWIQKDEYLILEGMSFWMRAPRAYELKTLRRLNDAKKPTMRKRRKNESKRSKGGKRRASKRLVKRGRKR